MKRHMVFFVRAALAMPLVCALASNVVASTKSKDSLPACPDLSLEWQNIFTASLSSHGGTPRGAAFTPCSRLSVGFVDEGSK
jgi:hypothetical protein